MTRRRLLLPSLLILCLAACSEPEEEEVVDPENPGLGPCGLKWVPLLTHASPLRAASEAEGADVRSSGGDHPETEHLLVRLHPKRDGRQVLQMLAEGRVRRLGRGDEFFATSVTPRERALLERHPDVAAVTRDRPVFAFGIGEYTPSLRMIGATEVWDRDDDGAFDEGAPTGQGVTLCVADSGLDRTHPELQAVYAGGYDFIDEDDDPSDQSLIDGVWQRGGGHGTHVAGTIAAQLGSAGQRLRGMDEGGVVGVAPGVRLLVARVLDTRGSGRTSDVIRAVAWCTERGAKIISMSLGSVEPNDEELAAMQAAMSHGVLLVAASGNAGTGDPATEPPVAFPAAYPGVVAVGAVDTAGVPTSYTQKGSELALVAPGSQILSCGMVGNAYAPTFELSGGALPVTDLEYAPVGGRYEGTLVDCGMGDSFTSCGIGASCGGFVAVVNRGVNSFRSKARYVMGQGARAIVFLNHSADADDSFTLSQPDEWVPAVMVSLQDADRVRARLGERAVVDMGSADYVSLTGTSMAAPHVAGAAALVWSSKPDLTPQQVRQLLYDTAKDLGPEGHDTNSGYGLVRPAVAIQRLTTPEP